MTHAHELNFVQNHFCLLFDKFMYIIYQVLLSNSTLPLMNSVQILNELSRLKTIHFLNDV